MTNRERENITLSFGRSIDRGAVAETFYPWYLTVNRWRDEGYFNFNPYSVFSEETLISAEERYLDCLMTEGVYEFEQFFGFDSVKRITFNLPFRNFDKKILEETDEYILKQDDDGWHRKYYKSSDLIKEIRPVVTCEEDWTSLKLKAQEELEKYYTDINIKKIYSPLKDGHSRGEYSIRLNISGFFWTPRLLFGIEEHMLALYDYPEILHDINEFILNIYFDKLGKVLDILPADVLYIMEDLSGTNGPMISPAQFDEFIGPYYKRLVPFLKKKGVKHIFVDTDGRFDILIPNFIEAGIEGFLPMDVNAGMDIVAVRKKFPNLKFIGAFNKLCIAEGKEAIDREFERILPVIRQGGYIPGADHQVAPSTSYENYKYYILRLKEVMKEACSDAG